MQVFSVGDSLLHLTVDERLLSPSHNLDRSQSFDQCDCMLGQWVLKLGLPAPLQGTHAFCGRCDNVHGGAAQRLVVCWTIGGRQESIAHS